MTTLAASTIAREDAKAEVQRFLEYCRTRNVAHKAKRPAHRPVSDNTTRLLAWLKEQSEPQTVVQIGAALDLSAKTVQSIVARRTDKIEEAGKLPRVGSAPPVKLWRSREV